MAANQKFQLQEATGWQMGLRNLLRKENGEYWKTRRLWVQIIIWMAIIVGSLLFITFAFPKAAQIAGETISDAELFQIALQMLFGISSIGITVGVIIGSQDEIIGEKATGTAAWVLSKPASRVAFYLSKLLSNSLSILTVTILLPFLVALGVLWTRFPQLEITGFLSAIAVLVIHTFFYLSLSLMLGVFSEKRSLVLSVTMGLLFGGQIVMNFIKELLFFTPFGLSQVMIALATEGVSTLPITLWIPVGITFLFSLIFVTLSVLKIKKLEF
jgi:ABC-2 type transport system permease protein